jgi:histidinol-phosphate aminotransferase
MRPETSTGVTRRSFFRLAAAGTAAAALPMWNEAQLARAQTVAVARSIPRDAIRIDANENPLGPCIGACGAMSGIIPEGGRYDPDLTDKFIETFSEVEGLKPGYVIPYSGSTEPLTYSVLAFTSKDRPYVTADPGYEAGMMTAAAAGAKVIRVPLTAGHAHDVKAMVAADANTGLIYLCNPNNPTGTATSREDIEYALANKPKGSILLLDEAYIHFSNATPCLDLVKADQELILLRTFSKIYGMAGLRCGVAIARPDLLKKLSPFGGNFMSVIAMASATASLQEKTLVPERKKINADTRDRTFEWLTANNYSFVPSQTNFFMLDTKRPGREVMAAMAKKNVYIGRVWPAWPTYVRITVGTRPEMEKFQTAFHEVMNSSTAHLSGIELPRRTRRLMFEG